MKDFSFQGVRDRVNLGWLFCVAIGVFAYEAHIYPILYFVFCAIFLLCVTSLLLCSDWSGVRKDLCALIDRRNRSAAVLVSLVWIYHLAVAIIHGEYNLIFRWLVFPFLTVLCLASIRHKHALHDGFLIVSVGCGLLSFGIQLGWRSLWDLIFLRDASVFFDPNYAGVVFGFAFIVCLTIFRGCFRLVAAPILFVALLLTYSRGAYFALMVSLIALFLVKPISFNRKWLVFGGGFCMVFVSLWIMSYYDLIVMRLAHGSSGRLAMWETSFRDIFIGGNLFGIGVGGLHDLLQMNGFGSISTHNFLVDNLVAYGVGSLLLWLFLILMAIYRSWRCKSHTFPALVFMVIISNFVVISVGGISVLSFFYCMLIMENLFCLDSRP